MVETKGKRSASYSYYYDKVVAKRMKYLKNVLALVAIGISIILRIPFGGFWKNLLLTVTIRSPIIFVGYIVVKLSRDKYVTVDFSIHKTLASQIYHSLISTKFVVTALLYLISSIASGLVAFSQLRMKYDYAFVPKEYGVRPIVNDEWVFFWFATIYCAVIYTVQHSVFQRHKLNFQYGVSKFALDKSLLNHAPHILGNTIFLNIVTMGSSPVMYWVLKPSLFQLAWPILAIFGLDTNAPRFHISFKLFITISYFSFWQFLAWDTVNHVYNVYSTLGCLDGQKPISTYSSDPINTLLLGLRNNDPNYLVSRLSAFQELAFIASSKHPEAVKLRMAVYSAHSKTGFLWPSIMEECALVIKETTARVNYRTPSDLKKLKELHTEDKSTPISKSSDIFGNSHAKTPPKNEPVNVQKYFEPKKDKPDLIDLVLQSLYNMIKPLTGYITWDIHKKFASLIQEIKGYYQAFLDTDIGVFFRITLKRDTESRVINPVNFGNAIFAISNLIIRSLEEDKYACVTSVHISEALNLLEKPIRATNNYAEYLPASVYLTPAQKTNKDVRMNHLIVILHDVAMDKFFELCIKFNFKLNDLILNARTFKLAKWVIDVAIAQQQSDEIKIR